MGPFLWVDRPAIVGLQYYTEQPSTVAVFVVRQKLFMRKIKQDLPCLLIKCTDLVIANKSLTSLSTTRCVYPAVWFTVLSVLVKLLNTMFNVLLDTLYVISKTIMCFLVNFNNICTPMLLLIFQQLQSVDTMSLYLHKCCKLNDVQIATHHLRRACITTEANRIRFRPNRPPLLLTTAAWQAWGAPCLPASVLRSTSFRCSVFCRLIFFSALTGGY